MTTYPDCLPSRYASIIKKLKRSSQRDLFYPIFFLLLLTYTEGIAQSAPSAPEMRARYSSNSKSFTSEQSINTRDGGTVIVGKYNFSYYWTQVQVADLMIMKIDKYGRVLWSKQIPLQLWLYMHNLCEMSDGCIVFAGSSYTTGVPILLIKFGCGGEIVWSKNISVPTATSVTGLNAYGLKEGKNNDIILSVVNGTNQSTGQFSVLCRISSVGNLVWSKTFTGYDNSDTQYLMQSFYANDKLFAFVFRNEYTGFVNYGRRIIAMKINYDDGTIELLKDHSFAAFRTPEVYYGTDHKIYFEGEQLSNNRFACFGMFANASTTTNYFYKMIFDTDLNLTGSAGYSAPAFIAKNYSKIRVFPNGETHIIGSAANSGIIYWYASDSLNITRRSTKRTPDATYVGNDYHVSQKGVDGINFVSAVQTYPTNLIEVANTNSDDNKMRDCMKYTDTSFVAILPMGSSLSSWGWKSQNKNEIAVASFPLTALNIPMNVSYLCQEPIPATPVAGTACDIALPLRLIKFTAEGNAANTLISWQFEEHGDGSSYTLQVSEDGINFRKLYFLNVATRSGVFQYQYSDAADYHSERVFYRLISTSVDGKAGYSDVVSVNKTQAPVLDIFPSPAHSEINLRTRLKIDKLEFYTSGGKLLKLVLQPDINRPVLIKEMPDGIYYLKVYAGGRFFVRKFVKR